MDMRRTQGESGAVGDSNMECGGWRSKLEADSRPRIVNRLMDILKRHLPYSGHEGIRELEKIAVRFEENIYIAATSRSDYLRKISLKILTMETRSQNPKSDAMHSNSGAISLSPSDPEKTMLNSMQPSFSFDSVSVPEAQAQAQQVNINPMMATLQPNPNMLHIKQQEQLLQSQQLKQFQYRQMLLMQQHSLHKQQLMQPTVMQSIQNQQSVVQQRQQQIQVQVQPTQLNPMGQQQQPNATNMQQIQLMGQQNSMYSEMQQMQQLLLDQQYKLIGQHNNLSASLDSTAQVGNPNVGDWQEEMYQKISAMKDLYLLDLNDLHQKIIGKLQQHESLPQKLTNEEIEKLKIFKNMLERFMAFLQIPKHNILANYKDKLSYYEKQIVHIITSNRPKPAATQQQPPPHKHSMQQSQHIHSASPLLAEFTSQGGNHDHCFAPKFLFFMECFFMFFFICYISILLMYALVE